MFANEVIVISEVINDILVRKYGRKDCHLIYNGVPTPDKINSTDYLYELGLKPPHSLSPKTSVSLNNHLQNLHLLQALIYNYVVSKQQKHESIDESSFPVRIVPSQTDIYRVLLKERSCMNC